MEFSTNLILSEQSNQRFQLLYTSQNYSTFYGIFGRFKVLNKKVVSVDLQLINFKGIIDLGIKSVEFKGFKKEMVENFYGTMEPFSEITSGIFEVEIQAINQNTYIPNVEINCDLADFEGTYISIRRDLVKINQNINRGVFDVEFEYRDGLRDPYPFSEKYLDYKSGKPKEVISNGTSMDKGPSSICPRSFAKVMF